MSEVWQESTQDDAIEVRIYDRTYRLRRTADPRHMQIVAGLVDERMKRAHSLDRHRAPEDLAVLAAMQLAHELTEAQAELEQLETRLKERAREMERSLDEKLRELGA